MTGGEHGKLSVMGLGFGFGVAEGLLMLMFAWGAWLFGFGTSMMETFGGMYPGFDATLMGGLSGFFWGFVFGFVFGFVAAYVYNMVSGRGSSGG